MNLSNSLCIICKKDRGILIEMNSFIFSMCVSVCLIGNGDHLTYIHNLCTLFDLDGAQFFGCKI